MKLDAARHYAALLRAAPSLDASPATDEAIRQYLAGKTDADCRKATLDSYAYHLRRLPPVAKLAGIGPAAIEKALAGLSARNRNNHLADWRTFFLWARKRGYVAADPTESVERAKADVSIHAPRAGRDRGRI